MAAKPEVILVHGLWFGAWSMASLAKKLEKSGFSCRRFSYRTTRGLLAQHAAALGEFANQTQSDQLHFVAHSLGGLVTLKMLHQSTSIAPGRVLLMGSPLAGSITARKAVRLPGGKKLLGQVREALRKGFATVPQGRETGMIAGTRDVGLGRLLGGVGGAGDGTVAIKETLASGLADRIELPVNHTGMLYSRKVADQAANFLHTGRFERPSAC